MTDTLRSFIPLAMTPVVHLAGVTSVEFYRDTNGNGVIADDDTFLGAGKRVTQKKLEVCRPARSIRGNE